MRELKVKETSNISGGVLPAIVGAAAGRYLVGQVAKEFGRRALFYGGVGIGIRGARERNEDRDRIRELERQLEHRRENDR